MASPETPADKMSFWEHLQELRIRFIRILIAIVASFSITYAFRFQIWELVQRPLLLAIARQTGQNIDQIKPWAFTSLTEPFFSLMRLSIWSACLIAVPIVFYQVWAFIRPGLLPQERNYMVPFVGVTSLCFIGGIFFAYIYAFQILGDVLFLEATGAGLRPNLHIDEYLDLFIGTLIMTGVIFELPVLFYFLSRFKVVTGKQMLKYWRHATFAIVVISTIATPGDVVVTSIFFSLILFALYMISVLVVWFAEPKSNNLGGE
ncbi:MAG: twin-arginine translocase subunit TatC [Holophagaceae bacterium]|jgi:sec-independent protein translocase protein TatC